MTFHSESLIRQLESQANQLRRDALEMIYRRQNGHPGGSLSVAEIMTALFFHKLRIDPGNPAWPERDRFLLSKGHASAIFYAALARRGFFPVEDLWRWGHEDCHLQGHPDRLKTAGVEMTSGLLGHGVSIGAGLALGLRLKKLLSHVYVLLGDGETQAGIIWEGAMMAAKYRLANLTTILDYNDVQLDGSVHDIMPLEPLANKWRAFNWHVIEVNGHNLCQVLDALDMADEIHHSPTMIIAHTTKGKGVSFMENKAAWHGAVPNPSEYQQAILELQPKTGKED
jgi:transketolase